VSIPALEPAADGVPVDKQIVPFGPLQPVGKLGVGKPRRPAGGLGMAAIGLEAEFELVVGGQKRRPEDVFGDPRAFLGADLVHREGTSYHLPGGAAVYFDTGVIEVATPPVEVEYRCAERAGRILWEGIADIRRGLDDWERKTGQTAKLTGFSAHYNLSFESTGAGTVEELAWLLVHILPAPVMLVASNRKSTGVGVRPRGNRIELTVDFSPSPALTIATAALVTGISRAVMEWPSYAEAVLADHGMPVIDGLTPKPHTSRQGWLAHATSYSDGSPFEAHPSERKWRVQTPSGPQQVSLREAARRVYEAFLTPIREIAGPFTTRLLTGLMTGATPSLLDLEDRPPAYDDVGRACKWESLFAPRTVRRSRYEQVLVHALRGDQLVIGGESLQPVKPLGWNAIRFTNPSGRTRDVALDDLVPHLGAWRRAARLK
jgi:hypothetical protein